MNFYDEVKKIWRGPIRPSIFNTKVGLGYLILNKLKQNPDRVMQLCDDTGNEMTCGEMFSRTAKISTFLSTQTNLKQGDVVGIIARNSENVAPVTFACFILGLPINPLAPIMSEREILEMYSKTKPKAIFCDFDVVEKVLKSIEKIGLENCEVFTLINKVEGFKFVDDILRDFNGSTEDYEPQILPQISSTPLAIVGSSGTTASMKGIYWSHECFIYRLMSVWVDPLGTDCSTFYISSLYWTTGICCLICSALFNIKRVITAQNMTADLFMDIVERRKVTSSFLAPFFIHNMDKSEFRRQIPYMRSVIIGGAALNEENVKKLKFFFPNATLKGTYGTTEAIILSVDQKGLKLGSSGTPLDNVKMKVIDDYGKSLGPNERGQICFKSMMFDGYYNDPEATKSTIDADGWCYTGDLGYFDDDGYIFVVNRIKHMLRYWGYFITPLEIESIINEIEGVLSSCVVGVYDGGNDIIFAFVIKDEKKVDLSEKFIENYVNEKVIDVKKIRGGVHFVTEFPMTPSGKIKNRELREVAEKIYNEGK